MKHRHMSALSDTQLILLSAASQRADQLLLPLPRLRGGAVTRVADSLLSSGLVEEIAVGFDQPSWREDLDQVRIGLKITQAGLQAIGLGNTEQVDPESSSLNSEPENVHIETPLDEPSIPVVRTGSKKALVLALLRSHEGAALDDLTAATGWLDHTTRAALSGLRHSGVTIERTKASDGRSVYRALPPSGEAS